MNKTPDDKFPCAACGDKFDTMDELAEHARVVHAGAPPRDAHRAEGEPEGPKTRGASGGEVNDMTRGQSSGRGTGGEARHPGSDGFVPVEDVEDEDKDKRDRPSTAGTSGGGPTP